MALYHVPSITLQGRTTELPKLEYLPNGTPTASITVAVNTKAYSKQANSWAPHGDAQFHNIKLFGEEAERAVRQLKQKGIDVLVHGDLYIDKYTPKGSPENIKVSVLNLRNATVAVVLNRFQDVSVARQESSNQQYNNAQPAPQQTQGNNGWQNQAQPQYNQQAPQYGQPQPQYNTGDWNAAPAGDEAPPF